MHTGNITQCIRREFCGGDRIGVSRRNTGRYVAGINCAASGRDDDMLYGVVGGYRARRRQQERRESQGS